MKKLFRNIKNMKKKERSRGKKVQKTVICFLTLLTVCCITGCSGEAENYYNNGIKCMNQKRYEQAASYFNEAIKKQDDKAEYYIAYGMALLAVNDFSGARAALERAVVEKDNSIVKGNNKLAYRGLGMCAVKEGNYEQAVDYLEKALEISVQTELNQDIYCFLTDAYMAQGKSEEALLLLEGALKEKEEDVLYVKRAAVYMELEEYEKALADYEKAKDRADSIDCIFGKYQAYMGLGRTEDAKAVLVKALEATPETDKEKYSYARIQYYAGNEDSSYYEESMKYFEEICDDYPESFYYMGLICQKQNNYEKACEYYEDYMNRCSESVDEVYLALGNCYEADGRKDAAIEVLKTGYERSGYAEKKKIAYRLTQIYEKNADFDSAYEFVREYTSSFPEDEAMDREMKFLKTRTSEFAKDHGKRDFFELTGAQPDAVTDSKDDTDGDDVPEDSDASGYEDSGDSSFGNDDNVGADSDASGADSVDADDSGESDQEDTDGYYDENGNRTGYEVIN